MKKIFIIILIAITGLSSCKKEDKPVFEKSPDERLSEALAAYQAQLLSAQNGWKGFIKTDSGRGSTYSFYFKFNNENRVVMLSDFDSSSAVTLKESSYRLKALQQPSLIFDTYSYLHVLSDPNETVSGGPRGAGLLSDFEFYFDTLSTDTINLIGRFNGSKLTLVRATQVEEEAYNTGQLAGGLLINKILTYFKRLTIGSQLYDVKIDPVNRQFTFSWLDANGTYYTFTTGYYLLAGGVIFSTPFVNGNQAISGFNNITWTPATETINLTVNGTAATITGIVTPLKVDVNAPRRWWQYAVDNEGYWISITGFHVNGVDDAFGVRTLQTDTSQYYSLFYWPGIQPQSGPSFDVFGPFYYVPSSNSLDLIYGTAHNLKFFPDGRVVFNYLGDLTIGPYPNNGPAALSRNQLYNSRGFYFVQTSATSYDMVSASDGKSWITWEF